MHASTCNLELRITSAAIHEAIITIIHGTVLKRSSHVHKVVHTTIWTAGRHGLGQHHRSASILRRLRLIQCTTTGASKNYVGDMKRYGSERLSIFKLAAF